MELFQRFGKRMIFSSHVFRGILCAFFSLVFGITGEGKNYLEATFAFLLTAWSMFEVDAGYCPLYTTSQKTVSKTLH